MTDQIDDAQEMDAWYRSRSLDARVAIPSPTPASATTAKSRLSMIISVMPIAGMITNYVKNNKAKGYRYGCGMDEIWL